MHKVELLFNKNKRRVQPLLGVKKYSAVFGTGSSNDWVRRTMTPTSDALVMVVFVPNNAKRCYALLSNRGTGTGEPLLLHTDQEYSASSIQCERTVDGLSFILGMKGAWATAYAIAIHGNYTIGEYNG